MKLTSKKILERLLVRQLMNTFHSIKFRRLVDAFTLDDLRHCFGNSFAFIFIIC